MGTTEPATSDDKPSPGNRMPSPMFVRMGLLAAVVTTVVLIALLMRGWYKVEFPNAAIVAIGDDSTKDVLITVRAASTGSNKTLASGKMVPGDHHTYVVLVREGDYIVQASLKGNQFMEQRVYVPADRAFPIEISLPPELLASTRPTSRPSIREAWHSESNLP